ncbi:hypothetical protein IAR55_002945 [Kwoniella newhampshirensis]|uniref:DRBM domain-containing protein n=1 Tax=Kwoniella newhampshirensis TaxID=1651941 RepID=A0AAW0YPE5_9TREE
MNDLTCPTQSSFSTPLSSHLPPLPRIRDSELYRVVTTPVIFKRSEGRAVSPLVADDENDIEDSTSGFEPDTLEYQGENLLPVCSSSFSCVLPTERKPITERMDSSECLSQLWEMYDLPSLIEKGQISQRSDGLSDQILSDQIHAHVSVGKGYIAGVYCDRLRHGPAPPVLRDFLIEGHSERSVDPQPALEKEMLGVESGLNDDTPSTLEHIDDVDETHNFDLSPPISLQAALEPSLDHPSSPTDQIPLKTTERKEVLYLLLPRDDSTPKFESNTLKASQLNPSKIRDWTQRYQCRQHTPEGAGDRQTRCMVQALTQHSSIKGSDQRPAYHKSQDKKGRVWKMVRTAIDTEQRQWRGEGAGRTQQEAKNVAAGMIYRRLVLSGSDPKLGGSSGGKKTERKARE